MLRVDQHIRANQWKRLRQLERSGIDKDSSHYKKEIKKLVNELTRLDKKNTSRVKKIIDKCGWPGISLVGRRGERAAWLLVQHATHDLAFQKRCLKILKETVEKKDADRKHVAYLTDRILIQEKKKQIYGTQFKGRKDGTSEPFPIKNVEKLARLRKSAGLEPFSQYKKKIEALNLR
ncbi:MAG: hypothetical protein Q8P21_01520 [bacterium]|nr:hypothetical protein [bacterium]